jgi:hypothetical protein
MQSFLQFRACLGLMCLALMLGFSVSAYAQETDITQTPNMANAGIKKSLADQVGGDQEIFSRSSWGRTGRH